MVQGTRRFIRDAVAPGGHELAGGVGVGAGVLPGAAWDGVTTGEGTGDGLGDGVPVGPSVADADSEGEGEPMAMIAVGRLPPPNGTTPRTGPAISIPTAAITTTAAATVIKGKPTFCSLCGSGGALSFARTVPLT